MATPLPTNYNFKNLTGQRFGRLVAVELAPRDQTPNPKLIYWKCHCDCGTDCIIRSADLLQGRVNSCKCLRNTLAKLTPEQLLARKRMKRNEYMRRFNRKKREQNPLPPQNLRFTDEEISERRSKYLENQKKWRNTRDNAQAKRVARHGISLDEYREILAAQHGLCAACGEPQAGGRELSIDHDHKCCPGHYSCGKCIRKLLCSYCNLTIGYAKEKSRRLRKCAEYLEAYEPITASS